MKKTLITLALLLVVAAGVAIGRSSEPADSSVLEAAELQVYGMQSSRCELAARTPVTSPQIEPFSKEEIEKVAGFVTRYLIDTEELPTGNQIFSATGVQVTERDIPLIQSVVIAKLADDPKGQELLAGSRCNDYGACLLHGNLAGASGEVLAMYDREISESGSRFEDLPLPEFSAYRLDGTAVSTAELSGKPTLLTFLAVHCNHSIDTRPILNDLERQYGSSGVEVIAVFVNSGEPEDLNYWLPHFEPTFDIWSYNDEALGDLVGSHLVPTYLFVDSQGQVKEKLVGFQAAAAVTDWVGSQLGADRARGESIEGS